jgi:hypothetical protein
MSAECFNFAFKVDQLKLVFKILFFRRQGRLESKLNLKKLRNQFHGKSNLKFGSTMEFLSLEIILIGFF